MKGKHVFLSFHVLTAIVLGFFWKEIYMNGLMCVTLQKMKEKSKVREISFNRASAQVIFSTLSCSTFIFVDL